MARKVGSTSIRFVPFDKIKSEDIKKENAKLRHRLFQIVSIIDGVDNRCMAADGPVSNTRQEMTDEELRQIYRLATGKLKVWRKRIR